MLYYGKPQTKDQTMKCTICHKEIVLRPTAAERAAKFGGKPSDYTKLFTTHASCTLAKRKRETSELCERLRNAKPHYVTL